MSLKRRKRARYITLSLFASAVMIVSFFLCVKMYCTILAEIFDFSKGYTLLSYLVLSVLFFCLLSSVYYFYLKNKFTLIVCLALLVIVGAFIYEPISEFYLQKSGIIPEKEKAYLFVGDKENSLAIKEAFDIARNKGALDFFSKEKLPFLKDTHGHYCNNNKVFRPMIFAGNYIYFKEYNSFIRVKRDDIVEVGGCKPSDISLLSSTAHDQTHDAHDIFSINSTLNIILWNAMTESTQLQ